MDILEKILSRYLRNHGVFAWIISLIIAIFLSVLANKFILLSFKTKTHVPRSLYDFFLLILVVFFTTLLLFLWQKIKYWRQIIFSKKEIYLTPPISKWEFQGSLNIDGDSLVLTSSDLGCLIKEVFFKNFVISFHVKIVNGGGFGIIFRGNDLENYLMLRIELGEIRECFLCCKDGKEFYPKVAIIYDIVPFVRLRGDLESFRQQYRQGEGFLHKYEKLENDDSEIEREKLRYDPGKGISVSLKVQDSVAEIRLLSGGKEETFCWDIPTHTNPNIFSLKRGFKETSIEQVSPEQKSMSKIWFRNMYGKIGFRANDLEKVIVSNLKIQKI